MMQKLTRQRRHGAATAAAAGGGSGTGGLGTLDHWTGLIERQGRLHCALGNDACGAVGGGGAGVGVGAGAGGLAEPFVVVAAAAAAAAAAARLCLGLWWRQRWWKLERL